MTRDVFVEYLISGQMGMLPKLDKRIRALAQKRGGKFIGSGTGCGSRDLQFRFGSIVLAWRFSRGVRRLYARTLRIRRRPVRAAKREGGGA